MRAFDAPGRIPTPLHRLPMRPSRWRRWVDDWWFAACGLALILGSDFKLRARDPTEALSGGVDTEVLIELLLYGAVGGYVMLRHLRPPIRIHITPPFYFAGCLVALIVVSVSYSPYPQYSLVRAVQVCILFALVVAAIRDATTDHLHRFAHAYLVLISASVVYGFARPSIALNRLQEGRFTWLAIHPTSSGVMTSLATMLAVAYLYGRWRRKPGARWPLLVYGSIAGLVGTALLATQTRGAVVGAAGAIVVLMLVAIPRRRVLDYLGSLIVVGAGAALVGSKLAAAYFVRGGDSTDITTLNSRTKLWGAAVDAISQQPMFGYGVTSARGIFYEAVGLGGGHNAVINVTVELGVVGLGIWLAIVGSLLVGLRNTPRRIGGVDVSLDRAMLYGIITFLMIDGVFTEGAGAVANVESTWFFVCVAWLAILDRGIYNQVPR